MLLALKLGVTMEHLAKKSFWATVWSLLDTFFSKFIGLFIGIVLARLLSPADFGIVGMMAIFIALSDVFIEAGFSNALVRKLDRNEADCSTAFFFNILVALVAYLVILLISPLAASFFNEPSIEWLLKVAGLNVVFYSLCVVPNALLIASFKIKVQTTVNLISNVIGGVIAIYLAYSGCGVVALVLQTLISNGLRCLLYWIIVGWRPKFVVAKDSVKYLWSYGSRSLAIGLIGTLFNNIYNVIIGKIFTKQDLGFYTRANQFAILCPNTLSSVFQKVSVATFASLQNEPERLLVVYRKYIHVIAAFIFPAMFLTAVLSKNIVVLLLTEKWLPCVLMMQILCVGLAFNPFGFLNISLLQALNHLDYSLKLEVTKKILYVLIIVITCPMGIVPLVVGCAVYNFLATLMNLSCSKKYISYKYRDQLFDLGKYLVSSIFSASLVVVETVYISNDTLVCIVGFLSFPAVYLLLLKIFKSPVFAYVRDLRAKVV